MRAARLAPGLIAIVAIALLVAAPDALAQARHPFSVGVSEGGGSATGLTGWILAQQQHFDFLMRDAVRAVRNDGHALLGLVSVAFAYGVFHAAGPGHGKAVLASYLIANERALRRGLVMAGLAALLQALVAIGLVGAAVMALGATAMSLRNAAQAIEFASYVAIAAVGAWLLWRKGLALYGALRPAPAPGRLLCEAADAPGHVHGAACAHVHMPDPALLSGKQWSWRDAAGTVVAAGLRPCSGAILVLVFAAAQGLFASGVAAVFAMAAGTALTTGALAAVAVHAKSLAQRLSAGRGEKGYVLLRGLECAAAFAVFLFGLGLVSGLLVGVA